MQQLYRRHFMVLLISAAVLVASALFLVRLSSIMTARQLRVIEARDRLASYELNKKIYAEEAKDLAVIETKTKELELYRITAESVPLLLSTLESVAEKNNIGFAISSVQTPKAKDTQKLVIDFTAKGDLKNINAFLDALLSQSFQVVFTRFSLSKDEAQPAVGTIGQPVVEPKGAWNVVAGIEIVSF